MTQTVSRPGVPFLMARDVAENISKKIRKEVPARQDSRIKKEVQFNDGPDIRGIDTSLIYSAKIFKSIMQRLIMSV